jgi:hypothetical protein
MAKKANKVPGKEEWAGYERDLDVRHAYRQMFGKTIDEVQILFGGVQSIGRADELLFMPRHAFRYYVRAFAQYAMSPEAAGDSATASSFLHLLIAREKRDPGSVSQVFMQLEPAVDFIAGHQDYFEADPSIFGDFSVIATEAKGLCALV